MGDVPERPEPLFPRNPGYHEDLTRKLKDFFPMPFDGAKVVLNKMMSSRFQLGHTINIVEGSASPGMPGSGAGAAPYVFQTTFVGKASHEDLTPVSLAEIDNSGNLNAQFIRYLAPRWRCKGVIQTQKSKWLVSQTALDYKGDTYSATVAMFNPDLLAVSGGLSANLLKRITRNFVLGSDVTFHQAQGQMRSNVGVCGKYSGANWEAFGNLSNTGFQAGYYKDCSSTSTVGVEWECSSTQGESNVSFGYKIDMTEAGNFVMKGSIDSTGTINAVYEKKMFPFTLSLSGSMNHCRGINRFGFGLTIG